MLDTLKRMLTRKIGDVPAERIEAAAEEALARSPLFKKLEAELTKELRDERQGYLQELAALDQEEAAYRQQAGENLNRLKAEANAATAEAHARTREYLWARSADSGMVHAFDQRRFELLRSLEKLKPAEYDQLAEQLLRRWNQRSVEIHPRRLADLDQHRDQMTAFVQVVTEIKGLAFDHSGNVADKLKQLTRKAEAMLAAPMPVLHCGRHKVPLVEAEDRVICAKCVGW